MTLIGSYAKIIADAEKGVKELLRQEYINKIGYDPFEDDPSLTTAEVEQTLREYDDEVMPSKALH